MACICLADLEFDEWALAAWPPVCDAVIDTMVTPVTSGRAEGDGAESST